MDVGNLIRRFRVLSSDKEEPYLWSDDELMDWLSDAQDQACIRGRLLRDDSTPAVCRITMAPGQHTYPLHPKVYELISVRLKPANGDRPRDLLLVSREWLDAERPCWRDEDRPACYAIQNDTSLRIVGATAPGDELLLECYRLPMRALSLDTQRPEIHEAHHEHLIQWVLHKAYSVTDAEAFDANRAALAEAAFTRYFGLLPDSDMRRITREDVPHHNVAILP